MVAEFLFPICFDRILIHKKEDHSLTRYKQHFLLLVSYKTSGSWIHDFTLHLALTKRGGANWDFELKPMTSPPPFCLPLGFLGINCDISLLAQDA